MKNSVYDPLIGASPIEKVVLGTGNDILIGNFSTVPTNSLAPAEPLNILEVTGKGIVSLPTENAEIQIAVRVEKPNANQVQQEIAQLSSAVVDKLNQLGVKELQTISISLDPKFKYDNKGNATLVGFIGLNVLQFQVPLDLAGTAIDTAIVSGANTVENITFLPDKNQLSQARLDALTLAVQDAQAQALTVLNTLNLKPIEITQIDIFNVSNPPAVLESASFLTATTFSATTPVIGGPQEITATVALDIAYG